MLYDETFIWVLRFWNQNLIWRGANPNSLLNCSLCFSSGCGHSLNILHPPTKKKKEKKPRNHKEEKNPNTGGKEKKERKYWFCF